MSEDKTKTDNKIRCPFCLEWMSGTYLNAHCSGTDNKCWHQHQHEDDGGKMCKECSAVLGKEEEVARSTTTAVRKIPQGLSVRCPLCSDLILAAELDTHCSHALSRQCKWRHPRYDEKSMCEHCTAVLDKLEKACQTGLDGVEIGPGAVVEVSFASPAAADNVTSQNDAVADIKRRIAEANSGPNVRRSFGQNAKIGANSKVKFNVNTG